MATRIPHGSRQGKIRAILFLSFSFILFCVATRAAATTDELSGYTERGKVVAVRVDEHTETTPVMPTDSKGRTHGGQTYVYRKQVYSVQTDDGIYELEGGKNPTMAVGDSVEFRIEKDTAHFTAGKRKKYKIILTTPKPKS